MNAARASASRAAARAPVGLGVGEDGHAARMLRLVRVEARAEPADAVGVGRTARVVEQDRADGDHRLLRVAA